MRWLALLLVGMVLAIQWPLWFGHGGWLRVWDMQRQLAQRLNANAQLRAHNLALEAELASLRQGSEAIEERARSELHMLRPEESFFQLPLSESVGLTPAPSAVTAPGRFASSDALKLGAQ